jgi:hypothetical protein
MLFANEEYELIIKEHKFIPDHLVVPANKKISLIIYNQDNEVEEFESFQLRREKIIPANGKIKINIGPLSSGEYNFFGDFHRESAKGVIIVN